MSLPTAPSVSPGFPTVPPRQRVCLNAGWRFAKEEVPGGSLDYFTGPGVREAVLASAGGGLSAAQQRLGADEARTQPGFDDSGWRAVDVPHDWGIEGPFAQELPGETGKLPWAGSAWYRKRFELPASDAGRRVVLEIDGAMAYAMVWCNGVFVGGWPYGYASFRLDLTDAIRPGAENLLAIRLSNPPLSSRWYPGSGLYRNIRLVKTGLVSIADTVIRAPEIEASHAHVDVRTRVRNASGAAVRVRAVSDFSLGEGATLFSVASADVEVAAGGEAELEAGGRVDSPLRWDTEDPACYRVVTRLESAGGVVDADTQPFGFRTIRFTVEDGFHLNGRRVQIRGVCNHHDLGALGAAFNVRAAERQLEILRDMGCNAIRTSHNPPAPELLDLCDRMGFVVMDEAFDCWREAKKENDYSRLWDDWHEKDLRAFIRRDRNHPCIVMWSIGNEVMELRDASRGVPIAAELTRIVHEEDPTRPAVLGSNVPEASFNGIQREVDVFGQNYQLGGYAAFRAANPGIPFIGSETASAVSSRGEYFFQPPELGAPVSDDKLQGRSDFQVSSYDLYAPPWAYPPDHEFRALEENPFVAGEFVWTGFDYLGEPTPYNDDMTNMLNFHNDADREAMRKELEELGKIRVPSRSSYFGIIDLAGFPKDRFYLYQSRWRPELPMAHILPHWTWPERVGLVTPVHVYTTGDEAELFLNGRSLGIRRKARGVFRLRWDDVVYEPGELEVRARKDGAEWARASVRTAGEAAKLDAAPDRPAIRCGGTDLCFVTVTVRDRSGVVVPRARDVITFSVEGPGEIVAVDNGDAISFEPFQAARRSAYNGRALVIVRGKPGGAAGGVTLRAESGSLEPATVVIGVS